LLAPVVQADLVLKACFDLSGLVLFTICNFHANVLLLLLLLWQKFCLVELGSVNALADCISYKSNNGAKWQN
jgi:hypothetical protein